MAKRYVAIRASYGFRGQYWQEGDIAESVKAEEEALLYGHFKHYMGNAPVPEVEESEHEPESFAELQQHEAGKPLKPSKKK